MVGDLVAIHEAVAEMLRAKVGTDVEVYAYPEYAGNLPKITVEPGDPYVVPFETFGANGRASVNLRIVCETNNQDGESAHKVLAELLSWGGDGDDRSILDTLMADKTLRGTVETLIPAEHTYSAAPDSYNPQGVVNVGAVVKKVGVNA